jgi:hypothetical protein
LLSPVKPNEYVSKEGLKNREAAEKRRLIESLSLPDFMRVITPTIFLLEDKC